MPDQVSINEKYQQKAAKGEKIFCLAGMFSCQAIS
jgi:hypothetical protein